MELEDVKTLLGIAEEDETYDARIEALIPVVEDEVKNICNNTFATEFPPAVKGVIADMIKYRISTPIGLKSKTLGDASETYCEGYPVDLIERLPRSVKFV